MVAPRISGPVFGGNLTALTFTSNGSTWREAAFDNVHATTNDTIRIYFSFQGVTGTGSSACSVKCRGSATFARVPLFLKPRSRQRIAFHAMTALRRE
jgi:hypothetical protein